MFGASEPSSERLMTCTEGFWKGLLGGGERGASVGASDACSHAQESQGMKLSALFPYLLSRPCTAIPPQHPDSLKQLLKGTHSGADARH